MATNKTRKKDANTDPLTGEPGSHPVGTGVGTAMGGAAAGVAAGAVAGPIGAAVGAIVGGVAGGLAGKAAAEVIDPTAEAAYWEENYGSRSYYDDSVPYDTYAPAYRHGWESRTRYENRPYNEVESELERNWKSFSNARNLDWERARPAVRDAWDRVDARYQEDHQE